MNGHALSGSRKLNKHWQSGGGGNFKPLTPWYAVQAINAGIGYSVVTSTLFINFPVVYRMPGAASVQEEPIIGVARVMDEDEDETEPEECHLGIKRTAGAFSKVTVTIKEKRNNTGIDWYIGKTFNVMYKGDGSIYEYVEKLEAEITGTPGTWYKETANTSRGLLSTLGCTTQEVYRMKDGVQIVFNNTSGKWAYFLLENFELYYIWDPEITADKTQYNSPEAEKFITIYNNAVNGGVFNSKVLNNLLQWQISIKAE